jgi:hypothetical protein
VDERNTVPVIEHNLDVIKAADLVIDLGPGGGDAGGEMVAEGTPEELASTKRLVLAEFFRTELVFCVPNSFTISQAAPDGAFEDSVTTLILHTGRP